MRFQRGSVVVATASILTVGGGHGQAQAPRAGTVYDEARVPADLAPLVSRAGDAMQLLQTSLLSRLGQELAAGGPSAAVRVCRDEAQAITRRVADEQGIAMGRTSDRLRNGANAPRDWVKPFVSDGSGRKAADVRPRVVDLGDRVGVVRPIGTADMCLRCHGPREAVTAAIGDTLASAYPDDRATGFATGDLRGWMWAEVPKPGR
jgi:hypothetical protein